MTSDASNGGKNDGRSQYLWDTRILSIVGCIILVQSRIAPKLEYDGVRSPIDFSHWQFFVGFPLFALNALAALAVMLVLLTRILRRPSDERISAVLPRYAGALLVVTCYVVTMSGPPRDVTYLRGLRNWVLDSGDLGRISDWLKSVQDVTTDAAPLPRSKWPRAVAELSPKYVTITGTAQSGRAVHLIWGGGFQHLGLSVAESDKSFPHLPREGPSLAIGSTARVWLESQ